MLAPLSPWANKPYLSSKQDLSNCVLQWQLRHTHTHTHTHWSWLAWSQLRACILYLGPEYARGIACIRNMLAIGLSSGDVMLFSVEDREVRYAHQLQGHASPIYDLATSQDGALAGGDEDGSITVWNDPLSMDGGKRTDIRIAEWVDTDARIEWMTVVDTIHCRVYLS